MEHRDRLARLGVEHLDAALSAQGRKVIVADQGETTADLVRDMYGRRGARNRAMPAVTATKQTQAGARG